MIAFSCTNCSEPLSAPMDLAGGDIQCPACGRLASVPLLSDLANLRSDGTLGVAPVLEHEDTDRLQRLADAFGRRRIDTQGFEIDSQSEPEPIALAPIAAPSKRSIPRYDPETGERIMPLELARPVPVPAVPMPAGARAATPSLGYATPGKTENIARGTVWVELLKPGNLFVLSLVWFAHIIGAIILGLLSFMLAAIEHFGGPPVPAWPFNLLFWLAVAHYANVIFETGENQRDDLPRPLGNGALMDDLLMPAFRAIVAFVLAYLPALVIYFSGLQLGPVGVVAYLMTLVLGGLVLPAMLMAACGSNSLANLRPDRLLNVVTACGPKYLIVAGLVMVFLPIYLHAALGINLLLPLFGAGATGSAVAKAVSNGLVLLPLMTVSVYVAHGVCWRLGQLQRAHYQQFAWAWEVHEAARLEERQRRQAESEAAARRAQAGAQ